MPSKALQSNNEYHQSYGFKGPFLVEPPSELDHATFLVIMLLSRSFYPFTTANKNISLIMFLVWVPR